MSDASPRDRGASCPACGRRVPWPGNPHRPFCSLTCRLVDLGVWLDEGYRIAAEPFAAEGDRDVP
ncbi:MAG TPA: DNA gyrase inhibitor YacG [Methylomirabilota bacterium]|nr:DNA gyrase inhibitor YacG [Methylomirabilota bacterium]